MVVKIPNGQIQQRPNCGFCNNNLAITTFGGKWCCGDCVVKWEEKKNMMIQEALCQ